MATWCRNAGHGDAYYRFVCLNAFTGRYIGSDGRQLKIQDLQNGRVNRDLLTPIFGPAGGPGLGDPTSTDITRTIQLSSGLDGERLDGLRSTTVLIKEVRLRQLTSFFGLRPNTPSLLKRASNGSNS